MKGTQRRQQGRGGFDLIEEATQLLRTAPVGTLAVYYLGAIPFVLGLLYFWADMSRSPFASQHLAEAALGMASLFLWMKFWQAVFACRVRAQIAAKPEARWTIRRCWQIFLTQAIVQPFGLFAIPLSLVPALPFAWVYAFYQNATALDDGNDGTSQLVKKSWRQTRLWPMQNHILLAVMTGFGFCVFLNWAVVCLALPQLAKMLFGIESAFTKSPFSMLNTTFFAGMFGLTYLCVDPILKVIYILRCFYGESLQSGEDLKAELKSFAAPSQSLAATLMILFALSCAISAKAADATPPAASPSSLQSSQPNVSPPDLDHAINQTIHESKYIWRMPREKIVEPNAEEGIVARFFDNVGKMLRKWAHTFFDWWDNLMKKLFPHKQTVSTAHDSSGYGWIISLQVLLYGLLAVVAAVVAVFLYRIWRDRRRQPTTVASIAIQPVPDITDENVRADQLPEDAWTKLARELLERGEFRLAMRAFYLASLSHLAARNLISIARFKSNREYERELHRRAHSFPDLLSVFGDNIFDFERIWYGMHEVNRDLVNQFAANVEKIKSAG
jgi:hypothetical protein